MNIKILLRLLKQSAIPALAATGYVLLRHWPINGSASHAAIFESFVAAFFLMSWFSGQVLRTAKQVHDEERFKTIIERLDGFDAKSLEAFKSAATNHVDLTADFVNLQAAVKLLVPEHIKGMVYALHLDQGDDPNSPYVKPWAVSVEGLNVARNSLRAAAERAQKAQT